MNKNTLLGYLDNGLRQEIIIGGKEPDIVKRYCSLVQTLIAPIFNDSVINKRKMSIRSGYIHRKPFVKFIKPLSLFGKSYTELGDILFVKKMFTGCTLVDIEITFSQVKKYHNGWGFEPHQFEFTLNHDSIEIMFGKKYQSNTLVPQKFFIPKPNKNLFNYLLLSNPMNLACSINRLKANYSSGNRFSMNCCILGGNSNLIGFCPKYDYKVFLNEFLFSKKGYGESVNGNSILNYMLDILYKAHGWNLDPPEEYAEWYSEENGGFGIIEFTLRKDEA